MTRAAVSTAEGDAMLAKLIDSVKTRLGRAPTVSELRRWARTYRTVAAGLSTLAGKKKRAAVAAGGGQEPT